MALNVANWTDKQLAELLDLKASADHSNVANFIGENWLCLSPANQGRIMDDSTQSTIRVTQNVGNALTVDISTGVLQFNGKVIQIDSTQTVSTFTGGAGTWPAAGVGLEAVPGAGSTRWATICIKQADLANTSANRWFVDDTTSPNTYASTAVNTLVNKAYYEIVIKYSLVDAPAPPNADAGYWAIAEVRCDGTTGLLTIIRDTTGTSYAVIPNWGIATRVQRLEFWSTLFGTDHYLTGANAGHHKQGSWQIDGTAVTSTGAEINQALTGIEAHVTAANLNILTHGSGSDASSLHGHGSTGTFGSSLVLSCTLTNIFVNTGLEVTITLSSPRSVLLMASFQPSSTGGWAHSAIFTDNGAVLHAREWSLGGVAPGGGPANWGPTNTIQEVASLTAGSHTIRVQAKDYGVYHVVFEFATLTVLAL
jgi:hypothetical protein